MTGPDGARSDAQTQRPLVNACFEVDRADLHAARILEEVVPPLEPGQVLLRIDGFGLTTNNITYAVTGDVIGYWRFFPAADGWGRIPAWGFADVVESRAEGIPAGARVFGYLPMSHYVVVQPERISRHGFSDGAQHREQLPPAYNRYEFTESDPFYDAGLEGLHAVLVPLFVTAFMLDDYLADSADFGAARIVISSASSKTSAATAYFLTQRAGRRPQVTGLTSPANLAFARSLGVYDEVLSYDDVASLDPEVPTVFVDMAGSATIRAAVHRQLGDRLMHSSAVGMAHWGDPPVKERLPGARPTFFFAPQQVEKRLADWGRTEYQARLAAGWHALREAAGAWYEVRDVDGMEGLAELYPQLAEGETPPRSAFMVRLRPR